MEVMNRRDKFGLFMNMGTALALVLLVNVLIMLVNPHEIFSFSPSSLTPPGYVIGMVWTVLFLLMGISRWTLVRALSDRRIRAADLILWLGLLCLSFPLYTNGLRYLWVGLAGNIVTLFMTLFVIRRSLTYSRSAALMLSPIALWLIYAALATAQQVRA